MLGEGTERTMPDNSANSSKDPAPYDLPTNVKHAAEGILDSIPALIYYKDRQGRILRANKMLADVLELPKARIEGRTSAELRPNERGEFWSDDLDILRTGEPKRGIVEPIATPLGTRWFLTAKIPHRDARGRIRGVVGFAMDVTEQRKMEEKILESALTDELTGLHNRRGFTTLAEQQMRFAKRTKTPMHLLYADVDGLKPINDRMGHQVGDRVVRETASLLRSTCRDSDVVARIGGDEFAVLMAQTSGMAPPVLVKRIRQRILQRNAEGEPPELSVSVGLATYDPANPCPIEELLRRADEFMYEEKRKKRLRYRRASSKQK